MNINKKLFYIFGGVATLIFFSVGFFVYIFSRYTVQTMQERNMEAASISLTRDINTVVESTLINNLKTSTEKTYQIIELYYNNYLNGKLTQEEMNEQIRGLILDKTYGRVGETGYFAVVKKDGLLLIHPKSEGVNVSNTSFWPQVTEIIESKFHEGYLEYNWKNPDETRERIKVGYIKYFEPLDLVIWASAYKSEFSSLIDKKDFRDDIISAGSIFNSYGFVLDSSGKLIIHPEQENNSLIEYEFIQNIIESKSGFVKYKWLNTGERKEFSKIAYYGYIEAMDWYVVISARYTELLRPLTPLSILIGAGLVVAVTIFLILSNFIGKLISRKIWKFHSIFKDAEAGNLTLVYETEEKKSNQDEIDEMGFVFNGFIGDYRRVLLNLREITDRVLNLMQSLSSSSQETSATSSQQSAAVKEIVSTMEDVDSLTKSIEKKIIEITKISDNTQETVKEGFSIVKKSIKKMEEINLANKTTIDGIKLLSERIDNIWDIVNMINGIADQTKIIAFNAELEASAAGEAGKNFQIVATEIRRLADSTVHSTDQIKEKISEIQKSSDRLILTSEDGTEKIKDGNLLTEGINNMFENILNSAEISTDSTKNISKSIAQQVVTFEQTLTAIKQISSGVDNIADAAKETASVSDNLFEVSESIESILLTYKLEKDDQENFQDESGEENKL